MWFSCLAKISGWMIFTYIIAKERIDTLYWANVTVDGTGFRAFSGSLSSKTTLFTGTLDSFY